MEEKDLVLHLFLPRTRGACLAHFRNILQLTQIDIAKDVGINRSSISKMENGDINVSEIVWQHVTNLVYQSLDINHAITFSNFRRTLDIFIVDKGEGRLEDWTEPKLFWQQETSI